MPATMQVKRLTSDYTPRAGDELSHPHFSRRVYVDIVTDEHVCYRITDGHGGLIAAHRRAPNEFVRLALLSPLNRVVPAR